ncbi:aldehyde dehydrogenase family protein [Duganella sp. FT92W]|uniref:Aldehyde dehydrogenase n=1 Tax=Pseudoduganella rivuli TaxID=2666085 RepID=A0A7X2IID3_9BURK|nr:aldehyde dehydrogenase family protein [Pseudoduganella rivuli]MRV70434.1 aldehyde dehydrogenase family protein [Pseudoduganella rivuli]
MNAALMRETPAAVIAQCFAAQGPRALALRDSTAAQRIVKLRRLQAALLERRAALHAAFARDFGKPAAEVDLSELVPVLDEIHAAVSRLHQWMRPRRVAPTLTTLGTSARVLYQPKGRCLIIGPWNYPVSTVIGPLVSAVAAGNTVIIKPSEFTPAVNAVLDEMLAAVFEDDEVAVLHGAVATAQALLDCPFEHIFFTGSPAVGKLVMAAAARHLASVTLELGGKSPVIVDDSADLGRAAEVIMWGKLLNAGQSCVAPDTLFVQRNVHDELLRRCRELIAARYGKTDGDVAASPDLARMIHARHAGRIGALIDDARRLGAQVVAGGGHDAEACYVAPTLLANVPPAAQLAREEIFGPVLPVVAFDAIDEVLAHINAGPKPLALYLWSAHQPTIARVTQATSSGSVVVNHCMQQYAHTGLPFGGANNSGIGNSHGWYGFKAFSHERAMLRGGAVLLVKAFFPPYTRTRQRLLDALIGWLRRF